MALLKNEGIQKVASPSTVKNSILKTKELFPVKSKPTQENDTMKSVKLKDIAADNGTSVVFVRSGKAVIEFISSSKCTGVERLVFGSQVDFNEASYEKRIEKAVTLTPGVKRIPSVSGTLYVMLLSLSFNSEKEMDPQEITISTTNEDGNDPEDFTFMIIPESKKVELAVISTRMINEERKAFPSKAASKSESGGASYFIEIIGNDCTVTLNALAPDSIPEIL